MNGEPKKLPVREFNKEEIEEIALGVCHRGIDLEKFDPKEYVRVSDLYDTNGQKEITFEQYKEYSRLLKKAIKDGVILDKNEGRTAFLFCNMVENDLDMNMLNACFGCLTTGPDEAHSGLGYHFEIELTESYIMTMYGTL